MSAIDIQSRVTSVLASGLPWLVAEEEGTVLGYAYAHPWAERRGYRTSVECSVYLAHDATGRGLGRQLYAELFRLLRQRADLHIVIGGVALPNEASVALHKSFGFEKVAHFKEVGTKFGTMIDVAYFQLWLHPEPNQPPPR